MHYGEYSNACYMTNKHSIFHTTYRIYPHLIISVIIVASVHVWISVHGHFGLYEKEHLLIFKVILESWLALVYSENGPFSGENWKGSFHCVYTPQFKFGT